MNYRQGSAAALCVLVLALAGCARQAQIDTHDQQTFDTSLKAMVAQAPTPMRKSLQADGVYFASVYFGKHPVPKGAPALQAAQGMGQTAFTELVEQIRTQLATPPALVAKPNPGLAQTFLHTLELDVQLLEQARTKAQQAGRYTIDEFAWGTPFFEPPAGGDTLDSHATFEVNFTNHAPLNVKPPVIHLQITDPAKGVTLLDQDLIYQAPDTGKQANPNRSHLSGVDAQAWIPPNQPTLITYTCCDLLTHPSTHATMSALPKDAQFHYSITSIIDYTRSNQLDQKLFAVPQYTELLHDQHCIAYLKPRLLTWAPGKVNDPCNRVEAPISDDAE